jgi:hypothetical protein
LSKLAFVLIIGPAFFDYTKAIAVEINSREVYAFVFNELHSETILSKIAYRLKLDFLFNLKVKKYRSKIYQYIDEHKITDVLFVSPDIIDNQNNHRNKNFPASKQACLTLKTLSRH